MKQMSVLTPIERWDNVECNLTRGDIKRGIPRSPYRCPVARSIARALPCFTIISSTSIKIHIDGSKDPTCICVTPLEVAEFIKLFDGGLRTKPFRFKLLVRMR